MEEEKSGTHQSHWHTLFRNLECLNTVVCISIKRCHAKLLIICLCQTKYLSLDYCGRGFILEVKSEFVLIFCIKWFSTAIYTSTQVLHHSPL